MKDGDYETDKLQIKANSYLLNNQLQDYDNWRSLLDFVIYSYISN